MSEVAKSPLRETLEHLDQDIKHFEPKLRNWLQWIVAKDLGSSRWGVIWMKLDCMLKDTESIRGRIVDALKAEKEKKNGK